MSCDHYDLSSVYTFCDILKSGIYNSFINGVLNCLLISVNT